jgi:sugar lactone lactonase YvrE
VSLTSPFQAAIDGAGNIYVANYTGNNVVKIAAGGGSASAVSTGAYTFSEPTGIVLDGAGNLYIADYGHSRILLVTSTGAVSVLSITGLAQAISYPAGLAMDAAGNLYVADYGNGRIVKVNPAGAGYVVATGSYTFGSATVTGVAVDASENVYIADRSGNRVVKVTPSGAASLVSVPGLTLANPQGVAADGNGTLYIADSGHRRVVQLTAAGAASVIQTPGQTIGTTLFGVTPDANGDLFIPDWGNNRVIRVTVSGSVLSFANTQVGATSSDSPETATVTNLGTHALAFSAGPTHPADFPQNTSDANLCASTTSLDPGEVCDVSASFTPQSAGSRTADLVVTNNHLNGTAATQTIAVSGTGVHGSASVTLGASANPALLSSSVTLTATVSSSLGMPTGSVAFYDGTTLLGSSTLASGVATYATSSLAEGAHSITAAYGGDSSFSSATSSALSLVLSDVALDLATGEVRTATVSAGGTATYHLTISPSSGSELPAAVSLSASGGPAGSTITITPQTIAAGAAATTVTVAVQVPATLATIHRSGVWAIALGLPLLGVLVPLGLQRGRSYRKGVLFGALLLVLTGGMLACGGSSSPAPPRQPADYTITVTAASGTVSHATTLTLTVQ